MASNLADLLRALQPLSVRGPVDRPVDRVTRDSREVGPQGVFVAIDGATVDGHAFVPSLGCAAAVVEREVPVGEGVTRVLVADTRVALARLSSAIHGFPSQSVRVVGITGTNGKTTTATLVEGALRIAGLRAARVGTTGNFVDGVARPAAFTTPEAPELQAFLAEIRDLGVDHLVMEASSIGLAQHRVDGIAFHVAAFTNLTQDHLDFHGDMAAYAEAKARLFAELLRPKGGLPRAVLCGDDPAWTSMCPPRDRWLYGFGAHNDLVVESMGADARGLQLLLSSPFGPLQVQSPLVGRHNALNLAGALGVLLALGLEPDQATHAIERVEGVPGRLEVVADPGGRLVVVDYAHTPDALDHALRTLRALTTGRLWVVFGCGGDRDRTKRPVMGAVARALADRVVLTSDNPRSEDPIAILAEISAGFADRAGVEVQVDRADAIRSVLEGSAPGDAVLIAGKGHETYQEVRGVRLPFDDREVARAVIAGLRSDRLDRSG